MRWLAPLVLALSTSAHALPTAVADAVAVADCGSVLAALPAPAADDERLAVAWCLQHDDPRRAEAVLAPVRDGVLGEYARWLRAEALLARTAPGAEDVAPAKAALEALDGLSLPGRPGLDVRLARGRALIALGRSLEARPDLRALLSTDVGDAARWWLAEGARLRGDVEPAVATFRATWIRNLTGGWSERSAERLADLGHPTPSPDGAGLETQEGRDLAKQRLAALEAGRRYADAWAWRQALEAVGVVDSAPTRVRAAFRARQYPEATRLFDEATASGARLGASTTFLAALAVARTGDYAAAADRYRALIAAFPGTDEAVEADWKLGYMAWDAGGCAQAVPLLQAHRDAHPRSDFAASALWFVGRCRWDAGDPDAAVAAWRTLLDDHGRSSLAPAARYWSARALGVGGDAEGEAQAMADLLRDHPASGHAWLAARRLGHRFPRREAVARPPWPARLAERSEVTRAETLLASGFRAWAGAELAPVRAALGDDRAARLAAAHAFLLAGDYAGARDLARPWCGAPQGEGDPVARQACWPRPEASIVERVARSKGVHPLLPYAVMWVESAMKPEATSLAGARGLMQIMPAEVDRLHGAAFGGGTTHPDRLYLAPYNAALGTTELGEKAADLSDLLEPDALPAVIASYNAGPDPVRRWVAEQGGAPQPMDEFMERISYTETRRYTRSVLGWLLTYLWVYGEDDPAPAP